MGHASTAQPRELSLNRIVPRAVAAADRARFQPAHSRAADRLESGLLARRGRAALDSLVAAFLWDNEQQRYLRWGPEDPDLINTLETVTPGSSLWLELRRAEVWPQGG